MKVVEDENSKKERVIKSWILNQVNTSSGIVGIESAWDLVRAASGR